MSLNQIVEKKIFKSYKQEAHGPLLAHLREIATADMHLLCNIFSILSLQVMKGSSFKQFLVLKKKDVLFYTFFFFKLLFFALGAI